MIAEDGVLADTKLIAEPWDAAGLYQVGSFPFGRRWSEWNGRYRDDVRRFWRGEPGMTSALATRLCGSADLYEASGRQPRHSINFITCHDGFTLWDLVSYNHKHNEANGEDNRDGTDDNFSWNCGVEGPTDDPEVLALRRRQARNLMATLLLSQGVPMLLAGDEFLRTQQGNNNAWCQDNDDQLGRLDAGRGERRLPPLRPRDDRAAAAPPGPAAADVLRGGGTGDRRPTSSGTASSRCRPDFSTESRAIAPDARRPRCRRRGGRSIRLLHGLERLLGAADFRIPASPTGRPGGAVDTALPSPDDALGLDEGPPIPVLQPLPRRGPLDDRPGLRSMKRKIHHKGYEVCPLCLLVVNLSRFLASGGGGPPCWMISDATGSLDGHPIQDEGSTQYREIASRLVGGRAAENTTTPGARDLPGSALVLL